MVQTPAQSLTLEKFLTLPETEPASEYVDGKIIQKPMPKTRHSRLQGKLIDTINQSAEDRRIAYAFPELRCTFGGRSIIPDIAVLRWKKIPLDENQEPLDDVLTAPDWSIEILSPGQSPNQVTGNILHCLKHGCSLGWLVDPGDRSILLLQPNQQPELRYGQDALILLEGIELSLTVNQIFGWLKM